MKMYKRNLRFQITKYIKIQDYLKSLPTETHAAQHEAGEQQKCSYDGGDA